MADRGAAIMTDSSSCGVRPRRVAYLSGPIDALKVADGLKENQQSDYYGTVYLKQLLGILNNIDADCLVISTLPGGRWRKASGSITVANIPMPCGLKGAFYHLAMIGWSIRCIDEIRRFRAGIAIFTAGQNYFWMFAGLRLTGVDLFASLHCSLWPKLSPKRTILCFHNWLNGRLFFPACKHIQAVSTDIVHQIVASSVTLRTLPNKFVPTYRASDFDATTSQSFPRLGLPFRLLYVGRIEENKGVFDLITMMRALEKTEPGRYWLTICGTGSADGALAQAVSVSGLGRLITVAGQCDATDLAVHYADCHAVLVPTRSTFEEGYAKVVAEAVLNLRPVITSAACPALDDVAKAAVEAQVDQVETYVEAVRTLATNPAVYNEKVAAAARLRPFYFDKTHSYGAVIEAPLRKALLTERRADVRLSSRFSTRLWRPPAIRLAQLVRSWWNLSPGSPSPK